MEKLCRDFAAAYDTPNTRRGIALAEAGTITWTDLGKVFGDALFRALPEVFDHG